MSAENGAAPETEPQVEPTESSEVLVRRHKALSKRDPFRVAQAFANSRYFADTDTVEKAVVKIIAGEEIGIGPMAAVKGITIIEGNLGYTGNLIATLVRQHPVYEYKVVEKTNEKCVLDFFDGEEWKTSEFTVEDAKRAQLVKPNSNWVKWPRAMCFNRAMTEGVRAFIPDLTAGTPAYTDDEIEEVAMESAPPEPVVEAEVVEESVDLPPERIEHLLEGIAILKPNFSESGLTWVDGLNLLLGSIGINAFSPTEELEPQLSKLSEEQAEALDREMQVMLDEETTAEAEVVAEGDES